jgi:plastocyanin
MRTTHLTSALIGLFALGLFGLGCRKDSSNPSYASSTPAPAPAANTVLMAGMVFSPATITISVGTTVTWKNNDGIAHTSTSDTGVWDTGNMAAGASTTTTFNTAGTFPYRCTYHATMGMKGTVIVQQVPGGY